MTSKPPVGTRLLRQAGVRRKAYRTPPSSPVPISDDALQDDEALVLWESEHTELTLVCGPSVWMTRIASEASHEAFSWLPDQSFGQRVKDLYSL